MTRVKSDFFMTKYTNMALVVLLALLLGGCASNGDPRDPLEPMNRSIHRFNEKVDEVALKPIAKGYVAVLPSPIRTGVRNVFSNVGDVRVFANNVLQLKLEAATSDFLRVAFNTTFGLLGVLDVASEMGLTKHNEDFGQTLGHWGLGSGPYVVLPLLGPSNVRDTAGFVVDTTYTDLVSELDPAGSRNAAVALRIINARADLLSAKNAIDTAALDGYEFTRDYYLERRRAQVHDGTPPRED